MVEKEERNEREEERSTKMHSANKIPLAYYAHKRVSESVWEWKRVNLNSSALVFSTCLSSLVSIRLPAVTHPLGKCFRQVFDFRQKKGRDFFLNFDEKQVHTRLFGEFGKPNNTMKKKNNCINSTTFNTLAHNVNLIYLVD